MTGRSRADLVLIGQQPDEPGRALKYDPRYCEEIRLLAQDGKFPETWCATIGIHKVTLYRWADDHPEFEEAVMIAWVLLQSFWTKYAVTNLTNTDLRGNVLIRMLQRRFPGLYGGDTQIEGTLEHFMARNAKTAAAPEAVQAPGDQPIMQNREAMLARIAELEQRVKHREAK